MEIRQLRHFVAAAEAGNLRKASQNIQISHPALSMSIKNLEADLGVTLLNKNRLGVQLTYAGKLFLKSTVVLLRQMDDLRSSLRGTEESPTGNVRLGIPTGLSSALAAPLYRLVLERFPGIDLHVEENDSTALQDLFDKDKLDVLLSYDSFEKTDRKCEPLYVEQLFFVSAYDSRFDTGPNGNLIAIGAEEMNTSRIASSSRPYSLRRTIERYSEENGIDFEYVLGFQSAQATLKIVQDGLANTIAPWDLIHDHVVAKLLSARAIDQPKLERTVYLTSSQKGTPSFATLAIIEAIKEAIELAKTDDAIRATLAYDNA